MNRPLSTLQSLWEAVLACVSVWVCMCAIRNISQLLEVRYVSMFLNLSNKEGVI